MLSLNFISHSYKENRRFRLFSGSKKIAKRQKPGGEMMPRSGRWWWQQSREEAVVTSKRRNPNWQKKWNFFEVSPFFRAKAISKNLQRLSGFPPDGRKMLPSCPIFSDSIVVLSHLCNAIYWNEMTRSVANKAILPGSPFHQCCPYSASQKCNKQNTEADQKHNILILKLFIQFFVVFSCS